MTMDSKAQKAKNARVSAAISATRAKRKTQKAVSRELKLDLSRASSEQKEALHRLFLEAKWYTNHLIASQSWESGRREAKSKTVRVLHRTKGWRTEPLKRLGSQVKQSIADQLVSNGLTLEKLERSGRQKAGQFRLRRFVNSVPLNQPGVTYKLKGNSVSFQKLPGKFRLFGTKQLAGLELSSARLVSRPSGFYLFITGWREAQPDTTELPNSVIGLDFGVSLHLTLSDGTSKSVAYRETDRLKGLRKKLRRQNKGSRSYQKTRLAIRREHEKVTRRRDAAAQQITSELLSRGRVFTQEDNLRAWKRRYGQQLHPSIVGRVKSRLKQNGGVLLPWWIPTTQWCSSCGSKNKLSLSQRTYECACGYSCERDAHAARNMVILGLLWQAQKNPGQELAGTLVEGLSDIALESAKAMLAPKKRETRSKEAASERGRDFVPAEAQHASAVA